MKRSADDGDVAVLMKDFDEADRLLSRVRPRSISPRWGYNDRANNTYRLLIPPQHGATHGLPS